MRLLARHPVLSLAFGLALALTLFFAGRFVAQAVYWSNPAHRNQPVAGWMTVGYVGHSWGLSPHEIDAEAGLPRPDGTPLTLAQIAAGRGVPVAQVIAEVEAALARLTARAALDKALPRAETADRQAGPDESSSPGPESGAGSGPESGAGSEPVSGPGSGPGSGPESGPESGAEAGPGSGSDPGKESGTGTGAASGPESGAASGAEMGTEPGAETDPNPAPGAAGRPDGGQDGG